MKTRFNTLDIVCVINELQNYVGMRVNNIYDIDNKTYLIKLQRTEEKAILLLESGNRIHSTTYEWPKNVAPCGFSMKMRKHLKNKRLESIKQLGMDRIIDLQFGSKEAAYHIIHELYDRGNIILTDYEMKILYILRPHTEADKLKFVVKEVYPKDRARELDQITKENLINILEKSKQGDQLKKVLVSNLEYGPAVIEHVLLKNGFSNSTKIGKNFNVNENVDLLLKIIAEAEQIFEEVKCGKYKGYIIQKKEEKVVTTENAEKEYFLSNQEFHPFLFKQHELSPYKEFDSFNNAVDEFFSSVEGQKIDLKALQLEREALKKLDNVKKDHDQRLISLKKVQELDKQKAELITRNKEIVEKAILAVQSAVASQLPWSDIRNLVIDAAERGDSVAKTIKELKLGTNHISLYLKDPYVSDEDDDDDEKDENKSAKIPSMIVDIDLALSAYSNATKYYDQKKYAAKKQQKTLESHSKALKSAEKKTKQTLKEVQTITNIHKARKVYWFEKFFWFISSENYLVIAGRDQQQNELIVKRYMKQTDVYVHADIHGASSVIVKNPTGEIVPPKTLNEAGIMAICYSVAWEAKVVTNAYWVWGNQVSKTAPTGEYLTTGSFMIRGKKNFLPTSHLILGFGFLFRLEDGSVENHKNERAVIIGKDVSDIATSDEENKDEIEVEVFDESDEEKNENNNKSENIKKLEYEEETMKNLDASEDGLENAIFPDSHLKIRHDKEIRLNILTDTLISNKRTENEETVIFLGDDVPVFLTNNQTNNRRSESKIKHIKKEEDKKSIEQDTNTKHIKRGQKSKLKKIKEKYKDQDEEERQLRMEILQSSGPCKESKKDKKNKNDKKNMIQQPILKTPKQPQINKKMEDDIDDEEIVASAEVDMIDTLTGIPTIEDELLFAIPVIAPYNTLNNYKFKVKLTPGTNKKGKAAKTAVSMFLKDRTVTQREKDLLKAVKDDQLARNFPGKVKLSAPRLQNFKK